MMKISKRGVRKKQFWVGHAAEKVGYYLCRAQIFPSQLWVKSPCYSFQIQLKDLVNICFRSMQVPTQGHNTKNLLDSRWRINNRGLSSSSVLSGGGFHYFWLYIEQLATFSPSGTRPCFFFSPPLGKGYCYLFLFSFLISLTSTRFSLQAVSFSPARINADFISMKSCIDTDLSFA